MILILPITEIFDKIITGNLVCCLELAFTYVFCQKFRENRMLIDFVEENQVLPILCVYFQ